MLNTIETHNEKINCAAQPSDYGVMPASWIASDIYASLLTTRYNSEFLKKFDSIPQNKLNEILKIYGINNEYGLFSDMYVTLGISIKDLKPRILRIINLVSFKDKEKRKIWELYGDFNDFDDFIEEHNAGIVKQIDSLLKNIF